MIYNEDFLFVHFPKAAGKSLTRFFLEVWERPVGGIVSKGQYSDIQDLDLTNVQLETGRGHENLEQSATILRASGKDLASLRAIFVCVRNPYDLMVSNYFYMRKNYKNNSDKGNFKLAANVSFPEYCARLTTAPPERWITYHGQVPANLRVLQFEQLTQNLKRYSDHFGFPMAKVPHLNATDHEHYLRYITPATERAIYTHFRFFFDHGYYQREYF